MPERFTEEVGTAVLNKRTPILEEDARSVEVPASEADQPSIESRKKREAPRTQEQIDAVAAEAARQMEAKRVMERQQSLQDSLTEHLLRRGIMEGDETSIERAQAMETLRKGTVADRGPVGDPGLCVTERLVVEMKRAPGEEGPEELVAYGKPQRGEVQFRVNPVTREVSRGVFKDGADGKKELTYELVVPNPNDPKDEGKLACEVVLSWFDAASREQARLAQSYGVPIEEMPFGGTEFAGRRIEPGYAAKAEAAAYALASLLGFEVIPPTILREDGDEVASVQRAAAGESMAESEEAQSIALAGPDHPGAESFMELAVMDYLLKSSDRHVGNIFYHAETKKFTGIDNGYSLGYSVDRVENVDGQSVRRNIPVDRYESAPLEIVAAHKEWKLKPETVARLTNMYNVLVRHFSEQPVPSEEEADTEVKILLGTFGLLHERKDEQGNVMPGSKTIAQKEAVEFLWRLSAVLNAGGRPPEIPPASFKSHGYVEKATRNAATSVT